MKLEELAVWLFGRTAGGIRWGLERTRELLAGAGDPHRRFRSIHVGGTNGKGSVAALCASALRAGGGRRVGLYTSPHLVSFTERIQIDGVPVDDERLLAVAERMRPAIERTGATFFEATTAIAFACFAEAGVDVAVVEVGLGGRLDATNVLEPDAAAVTNIGFDHAEYLGDTLDAIAREKAGIFKRGIPAVTAEQDPAVLAVLDQAASAAGSRLHRLDEGVRVLDVASDLHGARIHLRSDAWGERALEVPLAGAFQVRNALLAVELLALLPAESRPRWAELEAGFRSVRWPGRLHFHRARGTGFLLDVAHNPAGAMALAAALDALALPRPLVLVAGVLSDKDWEAMLAPLLGRADEAILTTPPTAPAARRWDPAAAAARLQPCAASPIRVVPDLRSALDRAASLAPGGTVVVTGSIHTVGDAMPYLGITPFGTIHYPAPA